MNARKAILKSIRRHELPDVAAPHPSVDAIRYANAQDQFLDALKVVGGQGHVVNDTPDIVKCLEQIPSFANAKRVCSLVPKISGQGVELDQCRDPHELADLDWAIIEGQFGVAENGAIWVTELPSLHRVVPFIAQHLAIVLPAHQIVDEMHQAYDRLQFDGPRFGVFLSGPSKTADIEQSLVIGAHGARSLHVFLVV